MNGLSIEKKGGWSVVQLHHDEGDVADAQDVRKAGCTFKRAELTAFLFLLRKPSGPVMVHVDNIIDGVWR